MLASDVLSEVNDMASDAFAVNTKIAILFQLYMIYTPK